MKLFFIFPHSFSNSLPLFSLIVAAAADGGGGVVVAGAGDGAGEGADAGGRCVYVE